MRNKLELELEGAERKYDLCLYVNVVCYCWDRECCCTLVFSESSNALMLINKVYYRMWLLCYGNEYDISLTISS